MLLGNEWLNPVNRWRNDGYFLFGKPPHIRNFITDREVSGRTKGFKEKEMNSKQMIEIDVSEGWEVIAYRVPKIGEYFITPSGLLMLAEDGSIIDDRLIVQKTKLRRIVLEETDRDRDHMKDEMITIDDKTCVEVYGDKIWRIKEE